MSATKLIARIHVALPEGSEDYDYGYRDALESMVLALEAVLPIKKIETAVQTALDAFENNVP